MHVLLSLGITLVACAAGPSEGSDTALRSAVVASLPLAPTSFGAAELDGWLYVYGGHLGPAHGYSRERQSGLWLRARSDSLARWELVRAEQLGVQSAPLLAVGGRLIAIGGMRASNHEDEPMRLESIDEVLSFDPATAGSTELPRLPLPRSSHAAVACGEAVFVVGGWHLRSDDVERGGEFAAHSLVIDLAEPEAGWREFESPGSRRGLALVEAAGRIVAIGGLDERGAATSRVDVLDVQTLAWSSAPELPDYGFGVAAAVLGGEVYASGRSGRIWRLRLGAREWTHVGNLVYPRIFHQMLAVPGTSELVVIGGHVSGQRVGPVERVALAPVSAAPVVSTLTVAAPGAARNRQAVALSGDRLEFFGGNTGLEQHGFEPERFSDEGWSLGLADLRWGRRANLPVQRQSLVTAPIDAGRVLAVGGFGHDGTRARSFDDAFVYDRELDEWRRAPSLERPRTQFALLEHSERIWLLGGLDFDPARGADANFAFPLEVLAASKSGEPRFEATGLELPRPRRAFGAAVLDGRGYLVGGMSAGFATVAECDVFDFDARSWDTLPPPRKPRISPDLIALGGRLYLCGGSSAAEADELGPDRSIEVFDPRTRTWSVHVEELPLDTTHARFFAWRDRILLVSTHVEAHRALEIVWIDPVADQASR
ncbi:MAG: hypothetical protein HZA52_12640 [Planctomycetes bacterium]|nr:hypothetical protein [Planctomycetota bacterium]